jgi:hypothetical protein
VDRKRWLGTIAAVLVLALTGLVASVTWRVASIVDRDEPAADDPGEPAQVEPTASSARRSEPLTDPRAARAVAAENALSRLERAVADGDAAAFEAVFAPGRAPVARRLFATLAALPLRGWDLRYVREERTGGSAWVGEVRATWSLRRIDSRDLTGDVHITFRRTGPGARVEAIQEDPAERTPEWLLAPLEVKGSSDALVISARPEFTDRIASEARRAVADVGEVVAAPTSPVVVLVPANVRDMARLLGGRPGEYAAIAAVTASTHGRPGPSTAARIVVNPQLYPRLGETGAQVVLTHEATHAATGAAATMAALWLVEGFADYVALADEPVPLDVAAAQILSRVRRDGPPADLPGSKEFSHAHGALGAAYEAAWLACRMIAEQTDEATLVRLYTRAVNSGDTDAALRDVLGLSAEELTRRWQRYLERLA